jgi:hypothetical protein
MEINTLFKTGAIIVLALILVGWDVYLYHNPKKKDDVKNSNGL